jgi:pyridoxamine 5'-phosphate oxidase
MQLFGFREEYALDSLGRSRIAADPIEQFRVWLDDAIRAGLREPNATALASAGADGRPAARMVLLKAFDARGFVFATSYASRKGTELEANPRASLLFYWSELERQVRIEGRVEHTSGAESDEIFRHRPRGARLACWASEQSRPLADRAVLEQRMREAEERFPDEVPRPGHWGGYRLVPERIEFWQGRPHRLHDRLVYTPDSGLPGWRVDRLAP